MESPFGLPTVHWDLEPRQLVGRGVLTAPRLGGLGTARPTLRFMESLLSAFFRMHWDHEPKMHNLFICKQGILRFMESPHGFVTAHWDHEPRQLVGRGVLT